MTSVLGSLRRAAGQRIVDDRGIERDEYCRRRPGSGGVLVLGSRAPVIGGVRQQCRGHENVGPVDERVLDNGACGRHQLEPVLKRDVRSERRARRTRGQRNDFAGKLLPVDRGLGCRRADFQRLAGGTRRRAGGCGCNGRRRFCGTAREKSCDERRHTTRDQSFSIHSRLQFSGQRARLGWRNYS